MLENVRLLTMAIAFGYCSGNESDLTDFNFDLKIILSGYGQNSHKVFHINT